MKKQIVLIKWIDSKGITNDWEFWNELEPLKPAIVFSVGFLIKDHPKYKTLSLSISKDQLCGRMTIPTQCIIEINEMRKINKEK